jgi:hypothetical protein
MIESTCTSRGNGKPARGPQGLRLRRIMARLLL